MQHFRENVAPNDPVEAQSAEDGRSQLIANPLASHRRARGVEFDREDAREVGKVRIRRQDAEPSSCGGGADEVVCVGALNPLRSAFAEKGGGFLVVLSFQRYVRERTKMTAQRFEMLIRSDAREEFLPDGAQHGRPAFPHQLGKFARLGARR